MIAARYASLIAFAQARAFCATGQGNGIDNSCGAKTMSAPDKDSGGGSTARPSRNPDTFPDTWNTDSSKVIRDGLLPAGLEKLGSFRLGPNATPREVMKLSQDMGIKSPKNLVTIGACNVTDADVTINQLSSNALTARADIPAGEGTIFVDTTIRNGEDGPTIDYKLLDLDDSAREQAANDEGFKRRVAGQMYDVMLSSMEAAEKAGFIGAETVAEGHGSGNNGDSKTTFQGYRLWGRFGFDAKVPRRWFAIVKDKGVDVHSALNPLDRDQLNNEGVIRLQQILATKQGEQIWKKWGIALGLTFDFTNKGGDGYLRYKKMLAASKRATSKRDFFEYVAGLEMREDPSLWSGFVEGRGFCPNGKGNGVTNTCGKGIGINDADQDFTGQILAGEKTMETRRPNSLKPYIGKTVGIVRTGKGKATLVGVMKVGEPKFYKTRKEFDADFDKHRVGKDSVHYIGPEGKYGYPLTEVKPVKPRVLKSTGHVARVIAKKVKTRDLLVEFDLDVESPEEPNTESRGDAPAPKKDQVKGSDVNDEGSAKNKSGDISLDEGTISSLKKKVEEHNAAMREAGKPEWTHVRLPSLKAVFRRGAGAFSTSHRPGMTRDQWAMARVNAFLTLARRGRPENSKYVTDNDLLHSSHPKHSKESRSTDCGREDDGKFGSGNKCAGSVDMPKEDPKGRMRYDNGVQTDAARKLYQMGSSEKKLKGLVDVMGGDPKSTRVDINPPSLNISVADKDGNKLFHVDLENGRARVYPAKDLNPEEAKKIREAAGEAFGGRQSDATIKVFSKATDMKRWESENAAKLKKSEDKYKFSTLLPPHQRPKKWERSLDARHASLLAFAESRECGQDPDGKFSKGNTCAGGIAADAAKGAATGAVFGAVSGFAKTFLPQSAATGAAAGAVAGAVKGIYDNQMRPTRVSARIEKVGMTDKSVAGLVKGLGGTNKSLASTNGRSGLTLTIRAKGGRVSHVVDITDKKVSIYPVAGRKEMTDDQIATIKQIASDNAAKETTVVVKTNSLSYASRLAKKGFVVAAKGAGVLSATAITSAYAQAAPDVVLGITDLVLDTHFTDSFYRKPDAKR
jgi:hypothetical protein